MNSKLIRNFSLAICLVLIGGLVGYKFGTNQIDFALKNNFPVVTIVNKETPKDKTVDFRLFWDVWEEVSAKYVDKSKIDQQKMVYGAISGMVSAVGDPYTLFLPPQANKDSKGDLNGTFEGIGAQLGVKDKRIVVIAPIADSPAQKAGVRTGDWIIKVDGKETANWTLPGTVAKIRGDRGSSVTLTVLHTDDEKPLDIKIVRDTVVLKSVDWKLYSSTASASLKPAAYLQLSRFGDRTDPQWDNSVAAIAGYMATSSAKTSGVILDLRNNPGGYLVGAVYVASEFMPSGVVVKQVDYKANTQTYSVDRKGNLLDAPLVVLVNQGTASAGEILAGALQASKRAKVVGMQTFGKGSVQSTEDLPGGAGMHITVAKWLLSNDFWVNGTGLTPDIKIDNDEKDPTRDFQLEKALEVLNQK